MMRPTCVSDASFLPAGAPCRGPWSFARPKSRIFTNPSCEIMMFSGFRSRCTIPAWCAFARPLAICVATSSAFLTGSGPSSSSWRSVQPSISSIARYGDVSARPTSKIVTMLGWLSAEAERASSAKRARPSGLPRSSFGSTFSATLRPSRVSSARYTSPIPPAPSLSMIWNGPSAVPAGRLFASAGAVGAPPGAGELTVAAPAPPPGEDCFTQTSARLRPSPR